MAQPEVRIILGPGNVPMAIDTGDLTDEAALSVLQAVSNLLFARIVIKLTKAELERDVDEKANPQTMVSGELELPLGEGECNEQRQS